MNETKSSNEYRVIGTINRSHTVIQSLMFKSNTSTRVLEHLRVNQALDIFFRNLLEVNGQGDE